MCGRVLQVSGPELPGLRIVSGFEGRDRRGRNLPPRYNAAPSQELWAIRQHPDTGERMLDLLK
jgi:putative SOS response-associated peptidase YedK